MIPSALEHVQEIAGRSGRVAVFLDYDGTLTPIVSQPENAWLSDSMRQTLQELAAQTPVAILRGMDGKKVYDLLPDADWDKGKAVLWLLEALGWTARTAARFTSEMTSRMKTLSVHLNNAASALSWVSNHSPPRRGIH